MNELKQQLLDTCVINDNQYLDYYVSLVDTNKYRKYEKFKTQKHHIIPRCFYKENGLPVNNDSCNLVNLLFKDHILAHCYLVLCAKENVFKYHNMVALHKLMNHRDFKNEDYTDLEEYQKAYECSREICYENNPMFIRASKEKHSETLKSQEIRKKISEGMRRYRHEHPFSEEHRRKLSESAKGNHNFGSGDTRSIACYCVLDTGEMYDFHSYKEAGLWWFKTLNPFDGKYSEPTFQRKIVSSIKGNPIIYSRGKTKIVVTNIKWYRKDGDNYEVSKN